VYVCVCVYVKNGFKDADAKIKSSVVRERDVYHMSKSCHI